MDLEPSILTKYTDFSLFWLPVLAIFRPEMKVHMSSEVPECTEINKNTKRDIESTSKLDHNHLKYI